MKKFIGPRATSALLTLVLISTPATAQTNGKSGKSIAELMKEHEILRAQLDVKLDEYLTELAMNEAMTEYGAGKFAKALPVFKRVSVEGTGFDVTTANFLLGQMYESGLGVDENETQAVVYYTLAAAAGWGDANGNLGNIYYKNGNYAGAAKEFRAFIANPETGDKADARYKLGMLYNLGNGVAQDYALAAEQFGLAANVGNGHNGARYEMGMLYLKGNGVGQDFTSAANYLQKAAFYNEAADEPGVPGAQYALSKLYGAGKGVPQSDAETAKYLRMAAHNDHTKAQFAMGVLYAMGKGVPQSIEFAYLWFARAAEGDAAFRSYSDTTKAALASTNGVAEAVEARDKIRARLTPEIIANGKVLVDRCIANKLVCNWGE